jgi:transaldolase
MINNIRKECPDIWNKERNDIKSSHPDFSPEQLVSYLTMKVVLNNCIELRPIFEATDGNYGFVNLQINPRNFSNHELMTEEIETLYEELAKELHGLPNVVFKVPGTLEGIETVKKVTARGIRVTITASCAIDQLLRFAEIIEQGNAKTSFLVMMTGRFDDPVREELIEAGVSDAAEISKCASAAVIRKSYDILYNQKEFKKSCILTASIRGPWNIEDSITDGNVPIFITCFPDKAVEYDSEERTVVSRISEKTSDMVMGELMKSRIFRQGFEVDSMTANEFHKFYPVEATLNQFIKNYDEMLDYVSR